jgi:hypothetical protein
VTPSPQPEGYEDLDAALAAAAPTSRETGAERPHPITAPTQHSRAAHLLGMRYSACHLVDELYKGGVPRVVWTVRSLLLTHSSAVRLHPREPLFSTARGPVTEIARHTIAAVGYLREYRKVSASRDLASGYGAMRYNNPLYSADEDYRRERRTARALAIKLAESYQDAEIDASGFDLVHASIRSPEWLQGMVWNDATRWSPGTLSRVREWSEPAGPDRWRITHRWPRSVP